jgi:hypothetical protein
MADGLDREFFVPLTDRDRLRVRLKTRPAECPTFAVMLECLFEGNERWIQVIRFDDWDGCPHIDRSFPDGTVVKEWLVDSGDHKTNAKESMSWLKKNWSKERARYEQSLE